LNSYKPVSFSRRTLHHGVSNFNKETQQDRHFGLRLFSICEFSFALFSVHDNTDYAKLGQMICGN